MRAAYMRTSRSTAARLAQVVARTSQFVIGGDQFKAVYIQVTRTLCHITHCRMNRYSLHCSITRTSCKWLARRGLSMSITRSCSDWSQVTD